MMFYVLTIIMPIVGMGYLLNKKVNDLVRYIKLLPIDNAKEIAASIRGIFLLLSVLLCMLMIFFFYRMFLLESIMIDILDLVNSLIDYEQST